MIKSAHDAEQYLVLAGNHCITLVYDLWFNEGAKNEQIAATISNGIGVTLLRDGTPVDVQKFFKDGGNELNRVQGAGRTLVETYEQILEAEIAFRSKRKAKAGVKAGTAGYTAEVAQFVMTTFPGLVNKPTTYTTGRATAHKLQSLGCFNSFKSWLTKHADPDQEPLHEVMIMLQAKMIDLCVANKCSALIPLMLQLTVPTDKGLPWMFKSKKDKVRMALLFHDYEDQAQNAPVARIGAMRNSGASLNVLQGKDVSAQNNSSAILAAIRQRGAGKTFVHHAGALCDAAVGAAAEVDADKVEEAYGWLLEFIARGTVKVQLSEAETPMVLDRWCKVPRAVTKFLRAAHPQPRAREDAEPTPADVDEEGIGDVDIEIPQKIGGVWLDKQLQEKWAKTVRLAAGPGHTFRK